MPDSITQRKEDERRVAEQGRLPPGQSLTNKFPVLHYGQVPGFSPETWDFRIWGEVEQGMTWDWQEFNSLPRSTVKMDIHCVTRWSKFDTIWEGVAVPALIEAGLLTIKPGARFVIQHAENEYTTNLPLEIVLSENFLLATHYAGEPLAPEHGYPLRGVVGHIPGREEMTAPYFWKGAKWLRGLEFSINDRPGFWEQAGYHNEGDAWKEERFRD